ncbi:hypothetical protein ACFWOX_30030 [Streptomyces sp. NPDC058467]
MVDHECGCGIWEGASAARPGGRPETNDGYCCWHLLGSAWSCLALLSC